MTESEWFEIVVPATVASADDVAVILASEVEEAAQGTQIKAADVVFWAPGRRCDQALAETRAALARMAEAGMPVDPAAVQARPAQPEDEWRDAWKRHFHTTRLTRQIVVVPSWETHVPADDDLVIHLDPGQAFGTGAHATTRALLGVLQDLRDRGVQVTRFLDAGTGSGILSIAAAKLWPASTGVAVDIDPLAVSAATENSQANQVAARIACGDTPVADIEGAFDLVLANIQANVLMHLATALTSRVAPGGYLLLAGLLSPQAEPVGSHLAAAGGLAIEEIRRSDEDPEWSSVVLRRAP